MLVDLRGRSVQLMGLSLMWNGTSTMLEAPPRFVVP